LLIVPDTNLAFGRALFDLSGNGETGHSEQGTSADNGDPEDIVAPRTEIENQAFLISTW
jgi:hypothetical protein